LPLTTEASDLSAFLPVAQSALASNAVSGSAATVSSSTSTGLVQDSGADAGQPRKCATTEFFLPLVWTMPSHTAFELLSKMMECFGEVVGCISLHGPPVIAYVIGDAAGVMKKLNDLWCGLYIVKQNVLDLELHCLQHQLALSSCGAAECYLAARDLFKEGAAKNTRHKQCG
ncbi:unnamed protein product, partial [Amoebophrya sp. A25]